MESRNCRLPLSLVGRFFLRAELSWWNNRGWESFHRWTAGKDRRVRWVCPEHRYRGYAEYVMRLWIVERKFTFSFDRTLKKGTMGMCFNKLCRDNERGWSTFHDAIHQLWKSVCDKREIMAKMRASRWVDQERRSRPRGFNRRMRPLLGFGHVSNIPSRPIGYEKYVTLSWNKSMNCLL